MSWQTQMTWEVAVRTQASSLQAAFIIPDALEATVRSGLSIGNLRDPMLNLFFNPDAALATD